ncbi:hypothetical protein P618_200264 [Holospora obtusa F1]|uniref:Tachykinin domain-containing protein n=1 Tax=Holospora obtusa F1 TaxID=1399147 RepID=W6TF19_HOLOB|nr:hypothetical protein [Holospora obtusa]ETZ07546.1 hypothetical protein P618_200264 [Holospora obtusa F1]
MKIDTKFLLASIKVSLMFGAFPSYGAGEALQSLVQITGAPLPSLPVLESYDFKGQTHVIFKGGSGILTGLQDVETLEVQNAETIILDSPILNALDIRVQAKTLVSKHKLVSKNVNIEVLNAWIGSGAQQVYQGSGGLSWSWQNQDPSLLLAHQYGVFPLTLTSVYGGEGQTKTSAPSGFRLSTWKSDLSQGWSVGALELKECARVWLCGELQVQNLSLSNSVLKLSGGLDAQHVVLDQASVCVEGLTLECLQGKFPITNPGAAYIKDIQGTGVISNQGGMVYLGNSGVLPVKLDVSCPNFGFGFGNWQSWTFVGGTVLQRNITGSSANLFSGRWIMGGCVGSLVAPDQGIQSPDSAILDWMNRVEARPQDADWIKTAEHRLQDADWMDAAGKRHFSNFIQGNRVWIQSWAPDIGGEVVWGASGNLKKGIVLAPSTATNIVFKNFDELLIVGDVCAQSVEFQGKRLLHMGKMVCKDAKLQLDTWYQWSGCVDWGQHVVDITNESWGSTALRNYGCIRDTHLELSTQHYPLFSALSNLSCLPSLGFFKTSTIDCMTFLGGSGFVGDGLVVNKLIINSGTLQVSGNTEIGYLQLAGTFVAGPQTASVSLKWIKGQMRYNKRGVFETAESCSGELVITPPAFVEIHRVQNQSQTRSSIVNRGGFLALHGLIDQRTISISGKSIALLPSSGNTQRSGLRAVPGTLFGESKAAFLGKQVLMPETVLGGVLLSNTVQELGEGLYFSPYFMSFGTQYLPSSKWLLENPQECRRKYLLKQTENWNSSFERGQEEDAFVQSVLVKVIPDTSGISGSAPENFDARSQVFLADLASKYRNILYSLQGHTWMFGKTQITSTSVFDKLYSSQILSDFQEKAQSLYTKEAEQKNEFLKLTQICKNEIGLEIDALLSLGLKIDSFQNLEPITFENLTSRIEKAQQSQERLQVLSEAIFDLRDKVQGFYEQETEQKNEFLKLAQQCKESLGLKIEDLKSLDLDVDPPSSLGSVSDAGWFARSWLSIQQGQKKLHGLSQALDDLQNKAQKFVTQNKEQRAEFFKLVDLCQTEYGVNIRELQSSRKLEITEPALLGQIKDVNWFSSADKSIELGKEKLNKLSQVHLFYAQENTQKDEFLQLSTLCKEKIGFEIQDLSSLGLDVTPLELLEAISVFGMDWFSCAGLSMQKNETQLKSLTSKISELESKKQSLLAQNKEQVEEFLKLADLFKKEFFLEIEKPKNSGGLEMVPPTLLGSVTDVNWFLDAEQSVKKDHDQICDLFTQLSSFRDKAKKLYDQNKVQKEEFFKAFEFVKTELGEIAPTELLGPISGADWVLSSQQKLARGKERVESLSKIFKIYEQGTELKNKFFNLSALCLEKLGLSIESLQSLGINVALFENTVIQKSSIRPTGSVLDEAWFLLANKNLEDGYTKFNTLSKNISDLQDRAQKLCTQNQTQIENFSQLAKNFKEKFFLEIESLKFFGLEIKTPQPLGVITDTDWFWWAEKSVQQDQKLIEVLSQHFCILEARAKKLCDQNTSQVSEFKSLDQKFLKEFFLKVEQSEDFGGLGFESIKLLDPITDKNWFSYAEQSVKNGQVKLNLLSQKFLDLQNKAQKLYDQDNAQRAKFDVLIESFKVNFSIKIQDEFGVGSLEVLGPLTDSNWFSKAEKNVEDGKNRVESLSSIQTIYTQIKAQKDAFLNLTVACKKISNNNIWEQGPKFVQSKEIDFLKTIEDTPQFEFSPKVSGLKFVPLPAELPSVGALVNEDWIINAQKSAADGKIWLDNLSTNFFNSQVKENSEYVEQLVSQKTEQTTFINESLEKFQNDFSINIEDILKIDPIESFNSVADSEEFLFAGQSLKYGENRLESLSKLKEICDQIKVQRDKFLNLCKICNVAFEKDIWDQSLSLVLTEEVSFLKTIDDSNENLKLDSFEPVVPGLTLMPFFSVRPSDGAVVDKAWITSAQENANKGKDWVQNLSKNLFDLINTNQESEFDTLVASFQTDLGIDVKSSRKSGGFGIQSIEKIISDGIMDQTNWFSSTEENVRNRKNLIQSLSDVQTIYAQIKKQRDQFLGLEKVCVYGFGINIWDESLNFIDSENVAFLKTIDENLQVDSTPTVSGLKLVPLPADLPSKGAIVDPNWINEAQKKANDGKNWVQALSKNLFNFINTFWKNKFETLVTSFETDLGIEMESAKPDGLGIAPIAEIDSESIFDQTQWVSVATKSFQNGKDRIDSLSEVQTIYTQIKTQKDKFLAFAKTCENVLKKNIWDLENLNLSLEEIDFLKTVDSSAQFEASSVVPGLKFTSLPSNLDFEGAVVDSVWITAAQNSANAGKNWLSSLSKNLFDGCLKDNVQTLSDNQSENVSSFNDVSSTFLTNFSINLQDALAIEPIDAIDSGSVTGADTFLSVAQSIQDGKDRIESLSKIQTIYAQIQKQKDEFLGLKEVCTEAFNKDIWNLSLNLIDAANVEFIKTIDTSVQFDSAPDLSPSNSSVSGLKFVSLPSDLPSKGAIVNQTWLDGAQVKADDGKTWVKNLANALFTRIHTNQEASFNGSVTSFETDLGIKVKDARPDGLGIAPIAEIGSDTILDKTNWVEVVKNTVKDGKDRIESLSKIKGIYDQIKAQKDRFLAFAKTCKNVLMTDIWQESLGLIASEKVTFFKALKDTVQFDTVSQCFGLMFVSLPEVFASESGAIVDENWVSEARKSANEGKEWMDILSTNLFDHYLKNNVQTLFDTQIAHKNSFNDLVNAFQTELSIGLEDTLSIQPVTELVADSVTGTDTFLRAEKRVKDGKDRIDSLSEIQKIYTQIKTQKDKFLTLANACEMGLETKIWNLKDLNLTLEEIDFLKTVNDSAKFEASPEVSGLNFVPLPSDLASEGKVADADWVTSAKNSADEGKYWLGTLSTNLFDKYLKDNVQTLFDNQSENVSSFNDFSNTFLTKFSIKLKDTLSVQPVKALDADSITDTDTFLNAEKNVKNAKDRIDSLSKIKPIYDQIQAQKDKFLGLKDVCKDAFDKNIWDNSFTFLNDSEKDFVQLIAKDSAQFENSSEFSTYTVVDGLTFIPFTPLSEGAVVDQAWITAAQKKANDGKTWVENLADALCTRIHTNQEASFNGVVTSFKTDLGIEVESAQPGGLGIASISKIGSDTILDQTNWVSSAQTSVKDGKDRIKNLSEIKTIYDQIQAQKDKFLGLKDVCKDAFDKDIWDNSFTFLNDSEKDFVQLIAKDSAQFENSSEFSTYTVVDGLTFIPFTPLSEGAVVDQAWITAAQKKANDGKTWVENLADALCTRIHTNQEASFNGVVTSFKTDLGIEVESAQPGGLGIASISKIGSDTILDQTNWVSSAQTSVKDGKDRIKNLSEIKTIYDQIKVQKDKFLGLKDVCKDAFDKDIWDDGFTFINNSEKGFVQLINKDTVQFDSSPAVPGLTFVLISSPKAKGVVVDQAWITAAQGEVDAGKTWVKNLANALFTRIHTDQKDSFDDFVTSFEMNLGIKVKDARPDGLGIAPIAEIGSDTILDQTNWVEVVKNTVKDGKDRIENLSEIKTIYDQIKTQKDRFFAQSYVFIRILNKEILDQNQANSEDNFLTPGEANFLKTLNNTVQFDSSLDTAPEVSGLQFVPLSENFPSTDSVVNKNWINLAKSRAQLGKVWCENLFTRFINFVPRPVNFGSLKILNDAQRNWFDCMINVLWAVFRDDVFSNSPKIHKPKCLSSIQNYDDFLGVMQNLQNTQADLDSFYFLKFCPKKFSVELSAYRSEFSKLVQSFKSDLDIDIEKDMGIKDSTDLPESISDIAQNISFNSSMDLDFRINNFGLVILNLYRIYPIYAQVKAQRDEFLKWDALCKDKLNGKAILECTDIFNKNEIDFLSQSSKFDNSSVVPGLKFRFLNFWSEYFGLHSEYIPIYELFIDDANKGKVWLKNLSKKLFSMDLKAQVDDLCNKNSNQRKEFSQLKSQFNTEFLIDIEKPDNQGGLSVGYKIPEILDSVMDFDWFVRAEANVKSGQSLIDDLSKRVRVLRNVAQKNTFSALVTTFKDPSVFNIDIEHPNSTNSQTITFFEHNFGIDITKTDTSGLKISDLSDSDAATSIAEWLSAVDNTLSEGESMIGQLKAFKYIYDQHEAQKSTFSALVTTFKDPSVFNIDIEHPNSTDSQTVTFFENNFNIDITKADTSGLKISALPSLFLLNSEANDILSQGKIMIDKLKAFKDIYDKHKEQKDAFEVLASDFLNLFSEDIKNRSAITAQGYYQEEVPFNSGIINVDTDGFKIPDLPGLITKKDWVLSANKILEIGNNLLGWLGKFKTAYNVNKNLKDIFETLASDIFTIFNINIKNFFSMSNLPRFLIWDDWLSNVNSSCLVDQFIVQRLSIYQRGPGQKAAHDALKTAVDEANSPNVFQLFSTCFDDILVNNDLVNMQINVITETPAMKIASSLMSLEDKESIERIMSVEVDIHSSYNKVDSILNMINYQIATVQAERQAQKEQEDLEKKLPIFNKWIDDFDNFELPNYHWTLGQKGIIISAAVRAQPSSVNIQARIDSMSEIEKIYTQIKTQRNKFFILSYIAQRFSFLSPVTLCAQDLSMDPRSATCLTRYNFESLNWDHYKTGQHFKDLCFPNLNLVNFKEASFLNMLYLAKGLSSDPFQEVPGLMFPALPSTLCADGSVVDKDWITSAQSSVDKGKIRLKTLGDNLLNLIKTNQKDIFCKMVDYFHKTFKINVYHLGGDRIFNVLVSLESIFFDLFSHVDNNGNFKSYISNSVRDLYTIKEIYTQIQAQKDKFLGLAKACKTLVGKEIWDTDTVNLISDDSQNSFVQLIQDTLQFDPSNSPAVPGLMFHFPVFSEEAAAQKKADDGKAWLDKLSSDFWSKFGKICLDEQGFYVNQLANINTFNTLVTDFKNSFSIDLKNDLKIQSPKSITTPITTLTEFLSAQECEQNGKNLVDSLSKIKGIYDQIKVQKDEFLGLAKACKTFVEKDIWDTDTVNLIIDDSQNSFVQLIKDTLQFDPSNSPAVPGLMFPELRSSLLGVLFPSGYSGEAFSDLLFALPSEGAVVDQAWIDAAKIKANDGKTWLDSLSSVFATKFLEQCIAAQTFSTNQYKNIDTFNTLVTSFVNSFSIDLENDLKIQSPEAITPPTTLTEFLSAQKCEQSGKDLVDSLSEIQKIYTQIQAQKDKFLGLAKACKTLVGKEIWDTDIVNLISDASQNSFVQLIQDTLQFDSSDSPAVSGLMFPALPAILPSTGAIVGPNWIDAAKIKANDGKTWLDSLSSAFEYKFLAECITDQTFSTDQDRNIDTFNTLVADFKHSFSIDLESSGVQAPEAITTSITTLSDFLSVQKCEQSGKDLVDSLSEIKTIYNQIQTQKGEFLQLADACRRFVKKEIWDKDTSVNLISDDSQNSFVQLIQDTLQFDFSDSPAVPGLMFPALPAILPSTGAVVDKTWIDAAQIKANDGKLWLSTLSSNFGSKLGEVCIAAQTFDSDQRIHILNFGLYSTFSMYDLAFTLLQYISGPTQIEIIDSFLKFLSAQKRSYKGTDKARADSVFKIWKVYHQIKKQKDAFLYLAKDCKDALGTEIWDQVTIKLIKPEEIDFLKTFVDSMKFDSDSQKFVGSVQFDSDLQKSAVYGLKFCSLPSKIPSEGAAVDQVWIDAAQVKADTGKIWLNNLLSNFSYKFGATLITNKDSKNAELLKFYNYHMSCFDYFVDKYFLAQYDLNLKNQSGFTLPKEFSPVETIDDLLIQRKNLNKIPNRWTCMSIVSEVYQKIRYSRGFLGYIKKFKGWTGIDFWDWEQTHDVMTSEEGDFLKTLYVPDDYSPDQKTPLLIDKDFYSETQSIAVPGFLYPEFPSFLLSDGEVDVSWFYTTVDSVNRGAIFSEDVSKKIVKFLNS